MSLDMFDEYVIRCWMHGLIDVIATNMRNHLTLLTILIYVWDLYVQISVYGMYITYLWCVWWK